MTPHFVQTLTPGLRPPSGGRPLRTEEVRVAPGLRRAHGPGSGRGVLGVGPKSAPVSTVAGPLTVGVGPMVGVGQTMDVTGLVACGRIVIVPDVVHPVPLDSLPLGPPRWTP